MDKYCGLIISECRKETGEEDYSEDNGVPQSTALVALNDAQEYCQGIIYDHYPRFFDAESVISSVASSPTYSLPANTYLGGAILGVFFSPDGQLKNYYELGGKTPRFRTGEVSLPTKWIPSGPSSFSVDPAPPTSSGLIKVIHGKSLDTLDLRRGKIKLDGTKDGGMTNYVSLELDPTDSTLDEDTLAENEFICVNDPSGNVTYYNIPYDYATGYNSSTKVLTFSSSQPVSAGSISVNSFITCGKYTTTHSKLDKICLPILRAFLNRKFYMTKSSTDVEGEKENIEVFTGRIIKAYQKMVRGPKKFPYQGKFE